MKCRVCGEALDHIFVDLGTMPLANSLLTEEQLSETEPSYPLRVFVCSNCFLVQVEDFLAPEDIFHDDYPYYSSYAPSWVEHARRYVLEAIHQFDLDAHSFVVEIASNDGYLLQFIREAGIPCLGIEPVKTAAEVAKFKGIPTVTEFFGEDLAKRLVVERGSADLIVANNVLAHVPDCHDFVAGISQLLGDRGTVSFEFPHLLRLIEERQFDTIYHEHYSYLSLGTVTRLLKDHGLEPFRVQSLPTHGGSLRVYAQHVDAGRPRESNVTHLLAEEQSTGLTDLAYYLRFQQQVESIRQQFLDFMGKINEKRLIGFGAAAKGNTFLNYCGITSEAISCVCDDTPAKQGRFLPQSHIPVGPTEWIDDYRPDYILILPWNLKQEIGSKLNYVREWGAKFVSCIPDLEIW